MEKTKKILITDFIEQYNKLSDEKLKDRKIKGIIKRTYCPILEKKLILDLMLKKSINEEGIKHIDLFVNRINFVAVIISLYTTLLPEKNEDGTPKTYEMYDLLVENDILNKILEIIGEKEITELTSINGVVMDNWYASNTSTEAYVSNLLETASRKFGVYIGAGLEKMADALGDEVKMQRATNLLDKVFKTIK